MLRRSLHIPIRCLLACLVVMATLAAIVAPAQRPPDAQAQDPAPAEPSVSQEVTALMARMGVKQRVGQLFVVSLTGDTADAQSEIAELITKYYIGGVQLRTANQNFDNARTDPPVTQQVARLSNALQSLAAYTTTGPLPGEVFIATPTPLAPTNETTVTITPTVGPARPPPSIPLFIAMAQDASAGYITNSADAAGANITGRSELNEITRGVTQLPSQMAIGATWNPNNAQAAGEVLGGELSKLGINVLFGPALDVVDAPKPNTPGDLGAQVFGGNPYWVGRMGSAFVAGVHRGSKNRMAVIARNFPGLGASDRDAREEVPTLQRNIKQLEQVELVPYFAVMRDDATADGTVDGLMVSHVRYRGLDGNIRANTKPISLDMHAYQKLMSLPGTRPWRENGGVTFSDSLGARSIRRFYDPLETSFSPRLIAQEAFAAGNDVLMLSDFGLSGNWDEQFANIKEAILYFQAKYREDTNFQARVDEAVARILSLKLRLYGGAFDGGVAQVDDQAAALLQTQPGVIGAIAKESITLLSPNSGDLSAVLPNPPANNERIVFITDDRTLRDCAQCAPYAAVPRTALQDIALNLYGPRTTARIDPARVTSFTFGDLDAYNAQVNALATGTVTPSANALATPTPPVVGEPLDPTATPAPAQPGPDVDVTTAISNAQWIVITVIDTNPAITSTTALRTFLSQSADTLRDKRVVVFALGAPYYLDATEISKVTAYYGVYSRSKPFLEGALRVLFGESAPQGNSPVDIPGLNYSLLLQTAPDPSQFIRVVANAPGVPEAVITDTQTTPVPLALKVGTQLTVRAGAPSAPIVDLNGHVVPDGTPVQFVLSYPNENADQPLEQRLDPIKTRNGIAETTIDLKRQGELHIRVEAGGASNLIKVLVDTTSGIVETIRPTAQPTNTPQLQPQSAATTDTRPAPTVATPDLQLVPPGALPLRASLPGFVITFIGLLLVGTGLFGALTVERIDMLKASARLRIAISLWMTGWLAYVFVAIGLPGTRWLTNSLGWGGSVVAAMVIALVGAGIVIAAARFSVRTQEEP